MRGRLVATVALFTAVLGSACGLGITGIPLDPDASAGGDASGARDATSESVDPGPVDGEAPADASSDASVDATPLPDAAPACPIGMVDTGGGFCIDATEVTQTAYSAFLSSVSTVDHAVPCAGNTTYTPTAVFGGQDCRWDPAAHPTEPVVCVDWCDAKAYCAAVGKHLCGKRGGGPVPEASQTDPAIDEWYFACSNNGTLAYPYGNAFVSGTCHAPGSPSAPVAVASKVGCVGGVADLHDMSGNVLEWEDSCNGATGGTDLCRIRGGSWYFSASADLRCDAIPNAPNTYHPKRGDAFDDTGFRCCK